MIDYSFSEFEADMDDRINSYLGLRERRKRAIFKARRRIEKRIAKEREVNSKNKKVIFYRKYRNPALFV